MLERIKNMSEAMETQRMYGGRPAATRSYQLNLRMSGSSKRTAVDRSRGRTEKQARKGKVFDFEPDPDFECCRKKKCSAHFTDAANPMIVEARLPLFDRFMNRVRLRATLRSNWNLYLRLPDGRRCCKEMMLRIYNCSPSLIYGNHRHERSQSEANSARGKVGAHIASWFHILKETADCMPDEGWYQLNIPLRSMVFANYNADAVESDTLMHCKSKAYFYDVWNNNFPETRLRKYCRFAKCDFCVEWRRIGQELSRRAESRQKLRMHRQWANVRERGVWHMKREKAIAEPHNAISISIDGMGACVVVRDCVRLCRVCSIFFFFFLLFCLFFFVLPSFC
jgi:hypothetical protein